MILAIADVSILKTMSFFDDFWTRLTREGDPLAIAAVIMFFLICAYFVSVFIRCLNCVTCGGGPRIERTRLIEPEAYRMSIS